MNSNKTVVCFIYIMKQTKIYLCYDDWFGCFVFNGTLRQYFSPYRAVSQKGMVGWCDGAG